MRSPVIRVLALAALALPVSASTWVVDDGGGPGVDFTSIASAVAASSPGDVILVRPGNYSGFTLGIGVSVLGDSNVDVVSPPIEITGVPDGQRATISRLFTRGVHVRDCAGRVTVEDVYSCATFAETGFGPVFSVDNSADVRFRAVDASCPGSGIASRAMSVTASRVEITHCVFAGAPGVDGSFFANGSDGGAALLVTSGSEVHVSLSTLTGGDGGGYSDDGQCPFCHGGNGGPGIRVTNGSALLVTGVPAFVVRGGQGGLGNDCSQDGAPANGITVAVGANARISGESVRGGTYALDCGGAAVPGIAGSATTPTPADASLQLSGIVAQGQHVTYTVHGAPNSSARLRLGRQLVVQDVPDAYEDRLTIPLRTYDLGTLPASGDASFGFTLPNGLPKGFVVVAQASTVAPSGTVTLTQSVPITLH